MRSKANLWLAAATLCASLLLPALDAQAAPDAWITAKVKMALIAAEGVPGAQVRVDSSEGRVTLFGNVATAAEKAKAEEVARGVQGAHSVRNLLIVSDAPAAASTRVSDAELKQAVDRAFQEDHALAGTGIEVRSAQNGVVYLSGTAKSFSEHRRAIGTAAGVLGVRRVESDVVAPEEFTAAEISNDRPFDATEYAKATASDIWITTNVKSRLLADAQTPGLEINVDTTDSRVTLFGTVDSAEAKRLAESEARAVAGVRDVENELQIVPPTSQPVVASVDADLTDAVEKRLAERDDLATNHISVQVENAVVRLTGSIDGPGDRLAAVTAAQEVVGVTKVIDDLRVEPPAVGSR